MTNIKENDNMKYKYIDISTIIIKNMNVKTFVDSIQLQLQL